MLGCDVRVEKGEEVGEKGLEGERVGVCGISGAMPLCWTEVSDDGQM
jgi:hypothetical protein